MIYIYYPNEIIAKNAFKSRALSFEYYINNNIILNKLGAKERQRVIYIFRALNEIEKIREDKIFEEKDEIHDPFIIEVDGVIFEPTDKVTNFDKNFFIPDSINKFCYFDNNPNEIEN